MRRKGSIVPLEAWPTPSRDGLSLSYRSSPASAAVLLLPFARRLTKPASIRFSGQLSKLTTSTFGSYRSVGSRPNGPFRASSQVTSGGPYRHSIFLCLIDSLVEVFHADHHDSMVFFLVGVGGLGVALCLQFKGVRGPQAEDLSDSTLRVWEWEYRKRASGLANTKDDNRGRSKTIIEVPLKMGTGAGVDQKTFFDPDTTSCFETGCPLTP